MIHQTGVSPWKGHFRRRASAHLAWVIFHFCAHTCRLFCLSLRRISIAQKEMEEVKLHIYSADTSTMVDLSFVDGGIKAGFPSPAQDYLSESIDLNKELIRRKETTFLARVSGNSLVEAGICDGTWWLSTSPWMQRTAILWWLLSTDNCPAIGPLLPRPKWNTFSSGAKTLFP